MGQGAIWSITPPTTAFKNLSRAFQEYIKMSINESVIKTIVDLENKLQELRKIVGLGEVTKMSKSTKSTKKAAKSDGESSEEPKEKKAPNAFFVFSARLRELMKANDYSIAPKDGFPQFAGYLNENTESHTGESGKAVKNYDSWTDEAILAERASWTKPEVSKQMAAGKNKRDTSSSGSAPAEEPVADEKPKAVRKPQSEETKAAAALKRAATKAAKEAASAPVAAAAPVAAVAAPAPAPAPKKKLVKKAAPKKLDLRFREWVHEGTTYYKNERGDVIDEAMSWVGRFTESSGDIDTEIEAPEDLGDIELIE